MPREDAPEPAPAPLTQGDVDLARRALHLKETPREGWRRVGVEAPESVADHAWGVALLALVAAARDPSLDAARLLEVALVHDLAEAAVGDLVPGDYDGREEKLAREREGLEALLAGAGGAVAARLRGAWREYAAGETREARLVADLDKLEMALQAERYGAARGALDDFEEFRASARARMRSGGLRDLIPE